jgi:hypothetical protein
VKFTDVSEVLATSTIRNHRSSESFWRLHSGGLLLWADVTTRSHLMGQFTANLLPAYCQVFSTTDNFHKEKLTVAYFMPTSFQLLESQKHSQQPDQNVDV